MELWGKTAIVTGSTAGLGFAIAAALAEQGAEINRNGRTAHRVNPAAEQMNLRTKAKAIRGIVADLGTDAGVGPFQEQVPRADILVNNLRPATLARDSCFQMAALFRS